MSCLVGTLGNRRQPNVSSRRARNSVPFTVTVACRPCQAPGSHQNVYAPAGRALSLRGMARYSWHGARGRPADEQSTARPSRGEPNREVARLSVIRCHSRCSCGFADLRCAGQPIPLVMHPDFPAGRRRGHPPFTEQSHSFARQGRAWSRLVPRLDAVCGARAGRAAIPKNRALDARGRSPS
jgi:hypothetical protein